jgi:flavodoxin
MKILVVYDSMFGNTQKVAEAIGSELKKKSETTIMPVGIVNEDQLNSVDLLVLGSPTHGGQATEKIREFIRNISGKKHKNLKAAVFDTRFEKESHGLFLKIVMKVFGFAANKMATTLEKNGIRVVDIEGYIVEGKEGDLKKGELERARKWVNSIL